MKTKVCTGKYGCGKRLKTIEFDYNEKTGRRSQSCKKCEAAKKAYFDNIKEENKVIKKERKCNKCGENFIAEYDSSGIPYQTRCQKCKYIEKTSSLKRGIMKSDFAKGDERL